MRGYGGVLLNFAIFIGNTRFKILRHYKRDIVTIHAQFVTAFIYIYIVLRVDDLITRYSYSYRMCVHVGNIQNQ